MLILLPTEELDDIDLTKEKLEEWKSEMQETYLDAIYFPKFEFDTKYFMKENLSAMGMPTAFTWPDADFSGMTGEKDLFISNVIHQAFVDVNEEGTEAAAATAVVMKLKSTGLNSPKIPTFMADHPFIFVIQQNNTGNILFMGRVIDPR